MTRSSLLYVGRPACLDPFRVKQLLNNADVNDDNQGRRSLATIADYGTLV